MNGCLAALRPFDPVNHLEPEAKTEPESEYCWGKDSRVAFAFVRTWPFELLHS